MKMNDQTFLSEVRKYIEDSEEIMEGEWGSCRDVDELIKEKAMPELYTEVLNRQIEAQS